MTTLEEVKDYQKQLITKLIDPNFNDLFNDLFKDYIQWLQQRYDDMDPETQEYVNAVFDKLTEQIKVDIEEMPEGIEKRRSLRNFQKITGNHQNIEVLFRALEAYPNNNDARALNAEKYALEYMQDILDMLYDISQNIQKNRENLLILGMFYGLIDEFLTSLHLARHHFYTQANAHLRTILETIDKLKLFQEQPEMLSLWINGSPKEKINKLSPKEVRIKLGKNKYDELYDFLCDYGTHTTIGSVLARIGQRKTAYDRKEVRIWYGGTPFEYRMIFYYSVALEFIGLTFTKLVDFGAIYLDEGEVIQILEKQSKYYLSFNTEIFIPWAKKNSIDSTDLTQFVSNFNHDNFWDAFDDIEK